MRFRLLRGYSAYYFNPYFDSEKNIELLQDLLNGFKIGFQGKWQMDWWFQYELE